MKNIFKSLFNNKPEMQHIYNNKNSLFRELLYIENIHSKVFDYRDISELNPTNNLLITCEHATNNIHQFKEVASEFDKKILNTHWGYDPGAKDVALSLAEKSKLLLIYPNFSRLLIDPNRNLLSNTLIRSHVSFDSENDNNLLSQYNSKTTSIKQSDKIKGDHENNILLGNSCSIEVDMNSLKYQRKKSRIELFYNPYYYLLYEVLEFLNPSAFISIHSFTKQYEDLPPREYSIGLLYNKKTRLVNIIDTKFKEYNISFRHNEPYTAELCNAFYCMENYNFSRRTDGVLLEIRNDLATDDAFRDMLVDVLDKCITEFNLNSI